MFRINFIGCSALKSAKTKPRQHNFVFPSVTSPFILGRRLCRKCDIFPVKRTNEIFAYVLEFMLTFDKMQNTSPLMCTKFEICGQSILEVIQAFYTVCIVLHIGCSGPVLSV